MSTRVKLVGLLAIPVIALVAVAFAFGFGNSPTGHTPTAEAVAGAGTMLIDVKDGKACIDPADTADFCVSAGSTFTVSLVGKAPTIVAPNTGYKGAQGWIEFDATKLTFNKPGGFPPAGFDTIVWPDLAALTAVGGQGVGQVNSGALTGLTTFPDSNFSGQMFAYPFTCSTADSVSTVKSVGLGVAPAGTLGTGYSLNPSGTVGNSDSAVIHCQVPPTPTITNTPTETFTPTPTNTQVSQPPFVKSPALQNLFLTRQGTKIPPVQCVGPQGSTDTAVLEMGLGVPIAAVDPKGSGKVVELGAFEFEVHYDANKVCVEIAQAQGSITMTCFIQDDVTKPVLEGVARIGCVTVGKKINVDGIWNMTISALGGALSANCLVLIQEAPLFAPLGGKGALVVTGLIPSLDLDPGTPGIQSCIGSVSNFGFFATQPGIIPGVGFNNQTGTLVAIIPCDPPFLGLLCLSEGNVVGQFTQEPTTLDLVFNGTFLINAGPAILPPAGGTISDGVITMSRKTRFALDLATVIVRPQPDVYSQAIPNQDNGVVVQLNNVGCEIADQQGHPIPHFSCGDADVTIRYLEGDVEPDCSVNTLDTQAIAFRWGASKGTLLFLDRFNLEPFGAQSDNDIDIKDLQAVYGRIGSTCANPHPDQPPVNPKA